MLTEPLQKTKEPPATIRKSTHDLALLIAHNMHKAGLSEEVETYFLTRKGEVTPAIQRGFVLPGRRGGKQQRLVVTAKAEVKATPLILTSTGPAFGEWLTAQEKMLRFLTGQKVILRDMFAVSDELLARTDIIPIFRPIGATNRIAVDWKKKLGIQVWEETDVMRYTGSQGPQVPELSYINRSIRPDSSYLGENAKSPIQLREVKHVPGTSWTNLYGWSNADDLHFKILDEHLDSRETLTWFPDDQLLPVGYTAYGGWSVGEVEFYWRHAAHCYPSFAPRLATSIPLKTKS